MGKGTFKGPGGSFMNREQKQKFSEMIETQGFGEDLLSEDDLYGGSEAEAEEPKNEKPKAKEEEPRASKDDVEEDVCPKCGTVLRDEINVTDEELTNYILGARVKRTFTLGSVEFVVQSILQREFDDASYRTGLDVNSDRAILDASVRNNFAFYLLVHQLVSIDGKKIGNDLRDNFSLDEMEKWHNEKLTMIKSLAHQFVTMITQKCSELEKSLENAMRNEARLKK
jgi:hypothetical protein